MDIVFNDQELNTLNTTFAPGEILGSTYLQR